MPFRIDESNLCLKFSDEKHPKSLLAGLLASQDLWLWMQQKLKSWAVYEVKLLGAKTRFQARRALQLTLKHRQHVRALHTNKISEGEHPILSHG